MFLSILLFVVSRSCLMLPNGPPTTTGPSLALNQTGTTLQPTTPPPFVPFLNDTSSKYMYNEAVLYCCLLLFLIIVVSVQKNVIQLNTTNNAMQ